MARFDPALVERMFHNRFGSASRHGNQGGTIGGAARRWNDTTAPSSQ